MHRDYDEKGRKRLPVTLRGMISEKDYQRFWDGLAIRIGAEIEVARGPERDHLILYDLTKPIAKPVFLRIVPPAYHKFEGYITRVRKDVIEHTDYMLGVLIANRHILSRITQECLEITFYRQ